MSPSGAEIKSKGFSWQSAAYSSQNPYEPSSSA